MRMRNVLPVLGIAGLLPAQTPHPAIDPAKFLELTTGWSGPTAPSRTM